MAGEREDFVLLSDVAEPILMLPARAELTRGFFCAVTAAGIEHDDFTGEVGAAFQTAGQVPLLVQRDEAKGDVHSRPPVAQAGVGGSGLPTKIRSSAKSALIRYGIHRKIGIPVRPPPSRWPLTGRMSMSVRQESSCLRRSVTE